MSSPNNFKPEVVVITGASAGVGRATARAFARRGARVALLARGKDGLEATRCDVETAGGRALPIPTDVAYSEQVEAAVEAVEKRFGPINTWVNNAMTTVFSPLKNIVYGTIAVRKRMYTRVRGTIVQVGSALAYRSIPLQAPYCGAKHAIVGFTDSLRSELRHDRSNIHLTMVQIPVLNTPQFSWCRTKLPRQPQPVPPMFQPEVAADAIVWAAHHRRREVYIGGATVQAIEGNKVAPGLLDLYLARTCYDQQQADEPVSPDRADNLFEPVAGDYGAHGIFDDKARKSSAQLWQTTHRLAWIPVAGLALAALSCALFFGNRG